MTARRLLPLLLAAVSVLPASAAENGVFLNFRKFSAMGLTDRIEDLSPARLTVRVLPGVSCPLYVSFPDGGSMLINTGGAEESRQVALWITEEFSRLGAASGLVKILGWKPRVDWMVLTSSSTEYSGGLAELLRKVEVKQMFVPRGMPVPYSRDISVVCIEGNIDIDLMQTISKVKMSVTGPVSVHGESAVTLKLAYGNYDILFLGHRHSREILEGLGKTSRSTIVFTDAPLGEKASRILDPVLVVPVSEKVNFACDGGKLYVENLDPELQSRIKASQAEAMLKEARSNYARGYYKSALRIAEQVLSSNPGMKQAASLRALSQAQVYFSGKLYARAQEELGRLLEEDPSNREAKMLLIRLETVTNVMSNNR